MILAGFDKQTRAGKNWRLVLDGSQPVFLFDTCGAAANFSPDYKFLITTVLWGDKPGLYQYSLADKKCTPLVPGITTYIAMYAADGNAFLYSATSHGETVIYQQPWKNGTPYGSPIPALKLPMALREDYSGNAFVVADDLSSVVYARPGGHDDLYLLAEK